MQRVGDLIRVHSDEGRGHTVEPQVKGLVADPLCVREAGANQRAGELPEGARLEDHPLPEQRLKDGEVGPCCGLEVNSGSQVLGNYAILLRDVTTQP